MAWSRVRGGSLRFWRSVGVGDTVVRWWCSEVCVCILLLCLAPSCFFSVINRDVRAMGSALCVEASRGGACHTNFSPSGPQKIKHSAGVSRQQP